MISAISWGRQSSPTSKSGCVVLVSAVTTSRMPCKGPFPIGEEHKGILLYHIFLSRSSLMSCLARIDLQLVFNAII